MVSSRTPSQMPLGEESCVDNCISVQRDCGCQHRNKGAVKAAMGWPLVTLLYSMVRLGSLGGQQEHSLKTFPHRERVVVIA